MNGGAGERMNRSFEKEDSMPAQPRGVDGKPAGPEAAALPRPHTTSARLMGGTRELIIEHAGDEYRLRITAKGKRILTK
jgi:hemin uptake protein HemP